MLFMPIYIFTILLGIWVLSLVGCIALGILCYRLIVDRGRLLLRLEQTAAQSSGLHTGGLSEGAYLSDVSLPLAHSESNGESHAAVSISDLIVSQARPQLLMFLDSDCLYSRALIRELSVKLPQPESPAIIAIIGGDPPDSLDFPRFPGTLLLDQHRQAAQIYGVTFTPAGYLVAPTRHTVSSLAVGPAALLKAAQGDATTDQPHHLLPVTPIPRDTDRHLPPLSNADTAPELRLVTAAGEPWSLEEHRGHALTLLFIDPDCPPCREVLTLVAACPSTGIAFISQGTPEDPLNEMAAALPGGMLLLQQQREAARAFHILDTPTIYELNAEGNISVGPIIGLQQITRYLTDGICHYTLPGTSTV